jgi:hypothetical protein
MSTLVRSQLLASLRASVQELDRKIEHAEFRINSFRFQFLRNGLLGEKRAELHGLCDERDALIADLETREEEHDLIWDLQCAFSDATDCDGVSDDALRSALDKHGLVVSRKKP